MFFFWAPAPLAFEYKISVAFSTKALRKSSFSHSEILLKDQFQKFTALQ